MRHFRWLLGLIILLAACTSNDDAIPTLMEFPTDPPTPEAQVASTTVFEDLPPTFTPTNTYTPSPTLTDAPPPTIIPTITVTPSATITDTPSPTWTPLPPLPTVDPERRPLLAFVLTEAANATVLPPDFVVPNYEGANVPIVTATGGAPTGIPSLEEITSTPEGGVATSCTTQPAGGFNTVFTNNTTVAAQLGCPVATVQDVPAAWQDFQQGVMVWLNGEMIVLYYTGQYQILPDTFVDGVDPQTSSETPPQGLFTPIRGFLKVWSSNPNVRNGLGWALNQERGVTAKVQSFQNGRMIYLPGRGDIFALQSGGTWQGITGSY